MQSPQVRYYMQRDPEKEAARWLKQARRDLDDAIYNLEGARHNIACFIAQQATEKALKAFLILRGNQDPWGHSVAELCNDAAQIDSTFGDLLPVVAPLDKFYIPTRYPNGLPGGIPSDAFSQQDAETAVNTASTLIEHVGKRI